MSKEAFKDWSPTGDTKALLLASMQVVDDYAAQGYQLTLRQLYYQLVARDLIPNEHRWYKKLGDVVSNGRLAGLIDWSAIVDRGRVPIMQPQWNGPADILRQAANQYRLDRWEGQENYVEVWCEKDALTSVLEPVCERYHVPFLANRGYSSVTAIYEAAGRIARAVRRGQRPVVIYLGDHDPSGVDMTRDVRDRLALMSNGWGIDVQRLALNYDQVEEYQPPPNPAKLTDSRAQSYLLLYGDESWELDALEPAVLDGMVSDAIDGLLDLDLYNERLEEEEVDKAAILEVAESLTDEG